MLTAMIQVDPSVYYAGRNPRLDNTFYNPDMNMSVSEIRLDYLSNHKIYDTQCVELNRPYDAYYEQGKQYSIVMGHQKRDLYFLNDAPFETTLQIVGAIGSSTMIAQDLSPDETLHFGYSPHYLIYTPEAFKIIRNLGISKGQLTGLFTFSKLGNRTGLALA